MPDSPTKNTTGPLGITIKTNGKPILDSIQVVSVRVFLDIGRIPEAVVVLDSGSIPEGVFPDADGKNFLVGNDITIAANYGDSPDLELFAGIISGTRMRIKSRTGPRLELTCRDKAIALTRIRTTAFYPQKKDSDVMTAIIKDLKLTSDIAATTAAAADQVRYDCTDWDFLRHLADRNGQVLSVYDGKITGKAPDPAAAAVLTLTLGEDIIEFDADVNVEGLITGSAGLAWDSNAQATVTAKSKPFDALKWGNQPTKKLSETLGDRSHDFATAREFEAADLGTIANARVMKSDLSAITGSCTFIGSNLALPGTNIELKNLGERFSGTAYVSGVRHVLEQGSWTTEAILGLTDDWMADLRGMAGASAAGLSAPIHGLQVGTVIQVHEDPDSKLRIKITLPVVGNPPSEVWARYAQPYATKEAGIQFMPEKDDEVLVGFLNADPNAPIVLGSVHNAKAAQANAGTAENFLKTIITKEKLKIQFDDEKKIILIETPGGQSITLDDDAKGITLADQNGNKIEMGTAGITISSASDISIEAKGKIDIAATADATLTGMNVTAEGNTGFTGKGGATAELSAGGQTTVKGAMVMIN